MKIVEVKDYQELSKVAAKVIIDLIKEKPKTVLGLATGSSPVGLYQNLITAYNNKEISFKDVKTYNLDEYCDLAKNHSQSYYTFMHEKFFNSVDINDENINIPVGNGPDLDVLCDDYNELLKNANIDLQILGIGGNGHIGFNEPGTSFEQETFVVKLTQKTRQDNKRFFNSIDEVPKYAITMGIKNIMQAKTILLIASGASKAEAINKLVNGPLTTDFPASILKNHKNVIVIIDKEAASLL